MVKITDIIRDKNLTTEQKNQALRDLGSKVSLDDNNNVITREEAEHTVAGSCAKEANGWGCMHIGHFTVKVHVINGVIEGGAGGNPQTDYVVIGDKKYTVDGDNLID